ncbi:MAG: DNA polymerase III subunit beta [Mariprofundaceae bacterium]
MDLTLSRSAILHAVQRCHSIVEKRHTTPILANILLEATGEDLVITSTDLDIAIRTRIDANVGEEGRITVSASKLFELLKELDANDELRLKTVDHFLSIQRGRSKYRLATMPADEYPSLPEHDQGVRLTMDGKRLAEMIAATSFAMSQDETRQYLTGTLIDVIPEEGVKLVATDSHRLSFSATDLELEQACQGIVPRKAIMEIRKIVDEVDEPVEIQLGERQLLLFAGHYTLYSKLIDKRFPEYNDVIPDGNPYEAIIDRQKFDQVLRRIMIVANEFTFDVRLQFTADDLMISAHNTELEQAEESIPMQYSGPEVSVGFNGRYLRDALGAMNSENIRMRLKDNLSPALLSTEHDDSALYVVMPMRI